MNVIKFEPAHRIQLLEHTNQIQYVAIKQLMGELSELRAKLEHAENLLKSLNTVHLFVKRDE